MERVTPGNFVALHHNCQLWTRAVMYDSDTISYLESRSYPKFRIPKLFFVIAVIPHYDYDQNFKAVVLWGSDGFFITWMSELLLFQMLSMY